jgi:hypothetical protein
MITANMQRDGREIHALKSRLAPRAVDPTAQTHKTQTLIELKKSKVFFFFSGFFGNERKGVCFQCRVWRRWAKRRRSTGSSSATRPTHQSRTRIANRN